MNDPRKFHWYPVDTAHVFATDNSGPWYKGGSWAEHVDGLPMQQRAVVVKEILDAVSQKRPYTHLRPATPFEDFMQPGCCAVVALDTKKAGDIQMCHGPVSHVRYWVEGNHFMGRNGFCAKHVAEQHGSDPLRMNAVGQSQPVIGKMGQPSKGKKI
jgi:hypothetical protein